MTLLRARRGPALAVAVTAALSLATPPALAAPDDPRGPGHPSARAACTGPAPAAPPDFNGDRRRDLVVAAPSGTADHRERAGHLAVLYGSASDPAHTHHALIHQDTRGIPGVAEPGDSYGGALGTGDLDRDGFSDLVVGSPGEDIGTAREDAGSLAVIWGGRQGLAASATVMDGQHLYGRLGDRLAVGDFDGDGHTDVAASDRRTDIRVLFGPFGRDGSADRTSLLDGDVWFVLDLAAGDVNGDGRTDLAAVRHHSDAYDSRHTVIWRGTARGPAAEGETVTDASGRVVQGGENLDLGDIDRDGCADIVAGRLDGHDSDLGIPEAAGGMITYIPGSKDGPQGARAVRLNQDTPGIPGVPEPGDAFGAGLSVGDLDGDGYADVSAGLPGKRVAGVNGGGAVITLRGGPRGLTGTGAALLTQNTSGVPGVAETQDRFGSATHAVDMSGDGRAELVASAVGENGRAGGVWAFRGTASGPTVTGSVTFGNGTLGAAATPGSELGKVFDD
ncbi:FG-GAP-like repeat-containing protein [Streptomyces sp. NPDC000594]|uniref:FG-GAP-like repeat-containing protein n=1 Tax=Streptomyces sp. NPDC000594 TaxID=3154261 RepID=UPI003319AF81